MSEAERPWYRELNRYHWFVLVVCTMGWFFDCLDQQLFALARQPAVAALLGVRPGDPEVAKYSGYATSILLFGWATGGIAFGIMGDRLGRALAFPGALRLSRHDRAHGLCAAEPSPAAPQGKTATANSASSYSSRSQSPFFPEKDATSAWP